MAGSPRNEYGLTEKQELFINAYVLNGGNGTQAAKDAGYADSGAHTRAWDMLRMAPVQARMETLCRDLMGKHAPAAIAALAELAVSSPSDTVRQAAASSLLDRTGYKLPILLEIDDHRTQQDVDRELSILLGLDQPIELAPGVELFPKQGDKAH